MIKPFLELYPDEIRISTFETLPDEGYEAPVNEESGEKFPNCCIFHSSIFQIATKWFETFPNCCDQHREMAEKHWFNKANYAGIENKIVSQLSYTESHVGKFIDDEDWYDDITDYIEYNVWSFGKPAIGLHIYLNNLQHFLETTAKQIPKEKRGRLIEFIKTYYHDPKDQQLNTRTDLNVLYSIYQKWLNIFPFDLSLFAHLKEHYQNRLLIIDGEIKVNRYLGMARGKTHTKGSLITSLTNLTNSLLTQINTYTLYDKGLLTEPQKVKLELLLNSRKLKLEEGYINNSISEELRYRKILKQWLKDELEFVSLLIPIMDQPNQSLKLIDEKTKTVIESLNKFRFSDFLKKNNRNPNEIYDLMSEHAGREFIPYTIALLHELKYLDYFFKQYATTKTKGHQKLGHILNANERRIKGNINVLNSSSKEDSTQYTSYLYLEIVKKELEGL